MLSDTPVPASLSLNTSDSLLVRAKARDDAAWGKLASLYGPMVYRWARRAGLQPHDAQDVVQIVFMAVASGLDHFQRTHPGGFRGWLWAISRHKVLDHFRERQQRPEVDAGSNAWTRFQQNIMPDSDVTEARDELCRLRQRALTLLRDQFENSVWQAFHRTAIHGDRPADVARDLGISVATVYRAKLRVLTQLKADLDGL